MSERGRIWQLDAIRGLLALGVMGYHLWHWPAAFGTWGVYAFFVLSGWALDHVYRDRFELSAFAVARVARLAPLWVPVVLVSAAIYGADPARILLNVTGGFGFLAPGATSIVTGGWSIGIEVVCYALFPLLVRLSLRRLAAVTVLAFVLRWVHVGGLMPADLEAEWVAYTVPQSFLVFFVGGMVLSRLNLLRPSVAPRWAAWLGEASYGTYLLHPLTGPFAPVLALLIRYGYEIPAGRWLRQSAKYRTYTPQNVELLSKA